MSFNADGTWTPDTAGAFNLGGAGLGLGTPSASALAALGGGSYNPNSADPFNLGFSGQFNPSALSGYSGSGASPSGLGLGLGPNIGTGQLVLGGLGTIGSLISGFGQLGIANKQLRLSTQMANTNLANQTQAYNTNLADRANVRAAWEGQTPAQAQQYITANSLKSFKVGG